MIHIEEAHYQLNQPIITSKAKIHSRKGWIVIAVQDKFSGVGEVLPLHGWSNITTEEALSQLKGYQNSETPLSELSKEVQSAITMALWNLEASKQGRSLLQHLGGGPDNVNVNALLDGSSQRTLKRSIEVSRSKGLSVFKVKLGFSDDEERLQLLSELVRGDEKIRLDPNGNWSLQYAVTYLDRARKLLGDRLEYVEDPVASLEDLEKLRSIVPVPVAIDGLWSSIADGKAVIQENLGEFLVIKPSLIGGINQTLEISSYARKSNIQTIISSTYDGPAALQAWCALAANVAPNVTHGLGTASLFKNEQMHYLIPKSGKVYFDPKLNLVS